MDTRLVAKNALGYQQLLAAAVDAGTGLTVPAGTSLAMVIPEAQAIRWRDDGTNPTATVGMPQAVGQTLLYTAAQLTRMRVISQSAGAIVNVAYYG